MSQIKRYGKPQGAPGIVVYEINGINQLAEAIYGTGAAVGVLKRGPMNVFVPVRSIREYMNLYGDPNDLLWHLYPNAEHLMPDFIDDYFNNANGAGVLFICRMDLSGRARPAELTLKNRAGADVLRVRASNEGRWGGKANKISTTPIIVATTRSFTIVAPGVESNEFVEAEVEFSGVPGKKFKVLTNTRANPDSGEVVFTVGAQHNLPLEGVTGPIALTGTASYTTHVDLTGTIACPLYQDLTGTASINNQVVTGTGTLFTTELNVGQNLYYNGEARVITSITSDTTLTIDDAYSIAVAQGATLQRDNVVVTGTGTQFTTELSPGDQVYVEINDELQGREVASVESATSLTLTSGYTDNVAAATIAQRDNLTVTGVGTEFLAEVQVGQFLVDPNRAGATVRVTAIDTDLSLEVEEPFSMNFAAASLTKQSQKVSVTLKGLREEGLGIKVGLGRRKPETHFSLTIFFNDRQMLEIQDCSLDPSDEYYVERVVDQANLSYTFAGKDFHSFIRCENLWTSDYTTFDDTDVRPINGGGKILAMTRNRIYVVADLEYDYLVGEELYPNPYESPRAYFRVQSAVAHEELEGSISSLGTVVTGTGTTFLDVLRPGDYLYSHSLKVARRIRVVSSDTSLTLETAFPSNLPALSEASKAGYIQVNEAYDLGLVTAVDSYFTVSHPQPLAGGYDGDPASMIPWYFQKYADPDLNYIERSVINRNMGLVRIFTPGISGIEIQKAFMSYAELKAFEYRCEIPSYISTAASAEAFVLQQLGRSDNISVAFPSYGEKSNPFGLGTRFVSLSGAIAGGESRRSLANRGYHAPYAGLQAVLPNVLKIPFAAEPSDEAILNLAGIQPILVVDGRVVVFGARGPSQTETRKFLHISRMQSHYTRIFLEARNLLEALFLPNQPGVLDQMVLILEQFARGEYAKGALTRYLSFQQAANISGDVTSTQILTAEDSSSSLIRILNGVLIVNFFYVPTGIVEVIEINTGPQLLVRQYGQLAQRR